MPHSASHRFQFSMRTLLAVAASSTLPLPILGRDRPGLALTAGGGVLVVWLGVWCLSNTDSVSSPVSDFLTALAGIALVIAGLEMIVLAGIVGLVF